MRPLPIVLAPFLLAACPGPDEVFNPPRLWLYLDGTETMVRLVPQEPQPY